MNDRLLFGGLIYAELAKVGIYKKRCDIVILLSSQTFGIEKEDMLLAHSSN